MSTGDGGHTRSGKGSSRDIELALGEMVQVEGGHFDGLAPFVLKEIFEIRVIDWSFSIAFRHDMEMREE